jgi:hypothetical protein
VVAVVLSDFDGVWLGDFLDKASDDPLGVAERVTAAGTRLEGEFDGFVGFGWCAEGRVMAGIAADGATICPRVFVFVFFFIVVGLVVRRLRW